MDPIGASPTWRWKGYDNAWVEIDGRWMQGSSSGGGWGGSMWIDAFDMGRVGLLALHRGEWDGERLLSEGFFQQAETPTKVQEDRGFINWNLNPDREVLPSAPESAVYHSGSGNRIYVDPEHELVVVIRWMDTGELDGLVERVLEAVDG